MKVKEFIEKLQRQDPERVVVLQSDPEGNSFSPLDSFWIGAYRPVTTWSGEAGLDELTEQDIESGYCEEDVFDEEGDVRALFLRPT